MYGGSVGYGLGWVGSVIWWVGLGWVDENRPTDNSDLTLYRSCETLLLDVGVVGHGRRDAAQRLRSDVSLPQLPGQRQRQRRARTTGRLSGGHCMQHESGEEVGLEGGRHLGKLQAPKETRLRRTRYVLR